MNNDDGFGSANLREFYKVLKSKGHNGASSQMKFYLLWCLPLRPRPLSLDRSARCPAKRPRRPFRLYDLSEPDLTGPVRHNPDWCSLSRPGSHRQSHLVLQRYTGCLHLCRTGLRPPQLCQLQHAGPRRHRPQLRHEPGPLRLDALGHGRRRIRRHLALHPGHRVQRVQQRAGLPQHHQHDERVYLRCSAVRKHHRCLRQLLLPGEAHLAPRLRRQCQLPQAGRQLVWYPHPPDEDDGRGKHEYRLAG